MMESAKPIEAGCRAMVIHSVAGNNGIVVTVIEYHPEIITNHKGAVYSIGSWLTDTALTCFGGVNRNCFVPEKQLMRIDDPDIQDQLEEESRKTKLDKYKEKVYANMRRE